VHLVAVALAASSAAMVAVHVDGTSVAPVSPPAGILNAYDRLSMRFAPNEGQAEPEADFVSSGAGYRVSGFDYADAVAVDHRENAYVTGATNSADFPTAPGALQPALGDPEPGDPDLSDAYVTKVDPSGSVLVYSTYLGGSGYDQALGIAVDVRGDVYVTGVTESTDFPTTPGTVQTALRGEADGFVTKLSLLLYGGSRTATVRR
jgi:hypothetical protein